LRNAQRVLRILRVVTGTLLTLTLLVEPSRATTILAFYSRGRIVIAADGLTGAVRRGAREESCKMTVGDEVAIASAGIGSLLDVSGAEIFSGVEIRRRVAARARGTDDAVQQLRAEMREVAQGLPWPLKLRSPDLYERLIVERRGDRERGALMAFLVAGVNKGKPSVVLLEIGFELPLGPASPTPQIAVPTERTLRCPTECPEAGAPLVAGLFTAAAAQREIRSKAVSEPEWAARVLLRAQSFMSPAEVGEPFALVEVGDRGVRWIDRGACLE
jgi:hypothetical protein